MAKQSVRRHRETMYGLGFLEIFWGFIVMLCFVIFGPNNHFSIASLPTLLPRIGIEVVAALLAAEATIRADRSTIGFLRILTIPFLLVVDIVLGYHLTVLQITGVMVMFFALVLAFHHNTAGKRGAWLVVLLALLNVAAASLFKYDITHYNSVAVEQAIVMGAVLAFFYWKAARSGASPLRLLVRPVTGTQALASGLGLVLASFAMGLAPASVVIALKRTFSLLWAVIFGQAYFHEHSMGRKAYSFGLTTLGILLLVSPYWPH